jgi:hypothetical protein
MKGRTMFITIMVLVTVVTAYGLITKQAKIDQEEGFFDEQ